MSKVGNYRVGLQEMPEYERGWNLYEGGGSSSNARSEAAALTGPAVEALLLGFNDAYFQMQVEGSLDG